MSEISMGNQHPRSRPLGDKKLKRCKNNFNNNEESMDVGTEHFDNIIVIDVPESLPKKTQHSSTYWKDKNFSFRNVIHIDDDDHNDVSKNAGFANNIPETAVRLSKWRHTYSGKVSGRSRFGLDSISDRDSSDASNGYSDCEIMEDVSGEVQAHWEKAFSRRRKEVQSIHSNIFDNGKDVPSCSRTKEETDQLGNPKNSSESEDLESDETGNFLRKPVLSKGNVLGGTHLDEAKEDTGGQAHRENGETLATVEEETCMVSEREKLKETDEYKRALEEELVSRQEAIRLQAEEAQHQRRLQKRKRAEAMRLLDMERRQRERIDEVRDIQRKDEENMNLKESIRLEVRMELNRVETQCHSMSSLLHLLGIGVAGWPNPMPQEVQTAYKRALLAFHPDRASRSDIRLQVEAEEKFKLINRLKMKFLP